LLTGYLEKRIGENSGRQSLPEAWRWQKRYFVLTEPKGMLYYFKSADDPPNYKGLINMRECKVFTLHSIHSAAQLSRRLRSSLLENPACHCEAVSWHASKVVIVGTAGPARHDHNHSIYGSKHEATCLQKRVPFWRAAGQDLACFSPASLQ
jgi:hypothetical protein